MQLSYVENSTYFLKMDSSLDGNMYMVLYKKISEDIGEQLFKVKITEHCYKRGSQIYHDLEERIKNNTLDDNYIEETKKNIAGLVWL